MAQTWLVRAGRGDELEEPALQHGLVLLRRHRVGDLADAQSQPAIRARVDRAYSDFSLRSRQVFAAQLFAFRCRMRQDDVVVLLRENAPTVAIGVLTGDYAHRPDLSGGHVRTVRWLRTEVSRSEVGSDLLRAPALTDIYKVNVAGAAERLLAVTAPAAPVDSVAPTPVPAPATPSAGHPVVGTALANLRRNLDYALSLATAGLHLQQLKVGAFEVADVYRAAWVQAVAALDHWVHQEIRERLAVYTGGLSAVHPAHLVGVGVSRKLVAAVGTGALTVTEAVEEHQMALGRMTFQQPKRISEGFIGLTDVGQLWTRVAKVLSEQAGDGAVVTTTEVEDRLSAIVMRRNKIAHEYDEDPTNPPAKRPIDAALTTRTVEWIGQVAEAIVVVLGKPGSPGTPNSPQS